MICCAGKNTRPMPSAVVTNPYSPEINSLLNLPSNTPLPKPGEPHVGPLPETLVDLQTAARDRSPMRVRDQKMRPRISTLTPREREILKLLAEGNSVKEIAVLLGLSVKTVEAHKFNLMRKLDIHNKAQLVTYAIQKKIIKIPVNQ